MLAYKATLAFVNRFKIVKEGLIYNIAKLHSNSMQHIKNKSTPKNSPKAIETHTNYPVIIPILITFILCGALVNSNIFTLASFASYFFYVCLSAILLITAGVILIKRKKKILPVPVIVLIFLLWAIYVLISGLVLNNIP